MKSRVLFLGMWFSPAITMGVPLLFVLPVKEWPMLALVLFCAYLGAAPMIVATYRDQFPSPKKDPK